MGKILYSCVIVWMTVITASAARDNDIICMRCDDADSPEHCNETTVCGHNEICFASEYTNHKGYRAYRLGCESKARCDLFLKASALVGKRHVPEPGPPVECYDCCSLDQCNSELCKRTSAVTTQTPTTTLTTSATTTTVTTLTTSTTTATLSPTTTGIQGCPANFTAFKDNCYLFDTRKVFYAHARFCCQEYGAHLVSVHSYDEILFLTKEIVALHEHRFSRFWTSGSYNDYIKSFEWADGSPFNYTRWGAPYPVMHHEPRFTYHIVLTNPVYYGFTFSKTSMVEYSDSTMKPPFGFICQTKRS